VDDPIRVLVFSGARYLRECLCSALNACEEINANSAETDTQDEYPADLLLVDGRSIASPVTAFIRKVRVHTPSVPIIYLESGESEVELVKVIEAGAAAYVTRNASIAELIYIVRTVLKGAAFCSPQVAHLMFCRLAELSVRAQSMMNGPEQLTRRELEIIELLEEHLTNDQIAGRLFLSSHTVRNHIHRILRKLRVQKREQAVAYIQRGGAARGRCA